MAGDFFLQRSLMRGFVRRFDMEKHKVLFGKRSRGGGYFSRIVGAEIPGGPVDKP